MFISSGKSRNTMAIVWFPLSYFSYFLTFYFLSVLDFKDRESFNHPLLNDEVDRKLVNENISRINICICLILSRDIDDLDIYLLSKDNYILVLNNTLILYGRMFFGTSYFAEGNY